MAATPTPVRLPQLNLPANVPVDLLGVANFLTTLVLQLNTWAQTLQQAVAGGGGTSTDFSPNNLIHWGLQDYPFANLAGTNNTYMFGDAGDLQSDVSYVMRVQGNARWEAGMVGATVDGVTSQPYHIKEVSGTYPNEAFKDRMVVWDQPAARYPWFDIYPASGTAPYAAEQGHTLFRVYNTPSFNSVAVLGNATYGFPGRSGQGLTVVWEDNSQIARFSSATWGAFYRDIVFEGNRIRFSAAPVFLNNDCWMINAQGSWLGSGAASLAASATVSNAGDGSIALMSGYVPGVDVLTATGGTGTAPTFTVTDTQVSKVNSIANAGSGGTPGAVVLTGTTGTGTKFQVNGTIGAGGTLTSVGSFVSHGDYTTNPTTLTAEPVTGGGLAGCKLNISMGALTVSLTSAGSLTAIPQTPTSTTSSAAGTGATLFILYTNGNGTINVAGGNLYADGVPPTGTGAFVRQNSPGFATAIALTEIAYANRPGGAPTGTICNFNDSNTAAWGATIAGGGTNHVLGRWNGANWTVVGA